MREFRIFTMLFLLILLIVGCNHYQIPTKTIGEGSLASPSPDDPSRYPLEESPSELIPTDIKQATPSKTVETKQTGLLLPSWTPLPTLSSTEKHEKIIHFLTNNTNCELPCWWGITPGKVSLLEARQYLAQFADRVVNADSGFGIATKVDGFSEEIASSFSSLDNDENVSLIRVQPIGTALRYQLYQILRDYGKPEEVILDALPNSPAGTPWYYLVVFYPQKGFSATYTGPADLENGGESIRICPQGTDPMLILVKPSGLTLAALKNLTYGYPPDLPSLDSYSGINIKLFYEKMQDEESCFVVSLP